jgi:hypothetical protein
MAGSVTHRGWVGTSSVSRWLRNAIVPRCRKGCSSRLIQRTAVGQLRAHIAFGWSMKGLFFTLTTTQNRALGASSAQPTDSTTV